MYAKVSSDFDAIWGVAKWTTDTTDKAPESSEKALESSIGEILEILKNQSFLQFQVILWEFAAFKNSGP